ncbi:MAG: protein kinase, partial [Cyanobacteria bacterium RYN_339]|nr:protein kinase [Cyanobacteria bacterium RYN_339]
MYHPADFPPHLLPVGLLGEGAFGRVHEAATAGGTRLAVKVLASEDPDAAWRFAAEYRRLERLDDPGFPRAIEMGSTPAGRPYYAMELIAGGPIVGPLPAAEVQVHLLGVARALMAAHALGWVHGDLKPDNVVVTPEGRHVLLDVGLMAPVGARREAIAGTLEYLAPEVLRKAPVAPAADMYALGALAYGWLTGRPPFSGSPADLVRAHLTQAPSALPGTSPASGGGSNTLAPSPPAGEVPV